MDKPRTSIKDVPIVNGKLFAEVAKLNNVGIMQVREIMEFTGSYISSTIKQGQMEAVMLPGFGKFKPKLRHLKALFNLHMNKPTGKEDIFRILNNKHPLKPKE